MNPDEERTNPYISAADLDRLGRNIEAEREENARVAQNWLDDLMANGSQLPEIQDLISEVGAEGTTMTGPSPNEMRSMREFPVDSGGVVEASAIAEQDAPDTTFRILPHGEVPAWLGLDPEPERLATSVSDTPPAPEPEQVQVDSIPHTLDDLHYKYRWADMHAVEPPPPPPPHTLDQIRDEINHAAEILFQNPNAATIIELDDTGDNERVIVDLPAATIMARTFDHLKLIIQRQPRSSSLVYSSIFHPYGQLIDSHDLHPHIPPGGGNMCADTRVIDGELKAQDYMAVLSKTLEIIQSWNPDDQHHDVEGLSRCRYNGCDSGAPADYQCARCENMFCEEHSGNWCRSCDENYCHDCMYDDPDSNYCNGCWDNLDRCMTCESIDNVEQCNDCNNYYCEDCMGECDRCNIDLCDNCTHDDSRANSEVYCWRCILDVNEEQDEIENEIENCTDWLQGDGD